MRSVCLPRHPAVAYLFLVRSFNDVIDRYRYRLIHRHSGGYRFSDLCGDGSPQQCSRDATSFEAFDIRNLHSVVSTTRRASGFKRIVLSRSPRLRISRRHRSRRLRSGHAPAVSSLRGGLLWTLGWGCGSTSVAWMVSGHARYQRLSWSSGLLAFTVTVVQ